MRARVPPPAASSRILRDFLPKIPFLQLRFILFIKHSLILSNKKVSTFLLLKKSFCNEAFSQQARSAKFQAKIAMDKQVLKIKKHSQRRREKGKIALIVVAAIAAKKILATMSAKCASACFFQFFQNSH